MHWDGPKGMTGVGEAISGSDHNPHLHKFESYLQSAEMFRILYYPRGPGASLCARSLQIIFQITNSLSTAAAAVTICVYLFFIEVVTRIIFKL